MNYRHVSTKEVIAKVFRDLKPGNASWTMDAVEWIGEALDFIGYHGVFDHKAKELTVANHKAEIPCGRADKSYRRSQLSCFHLEVHQERKQQQRLLPGQWRVHRNKF